MAFEVTRQEILKQANDLLRLYRQTRTQKYKDEENRLRRIVAELEAFTGGGGASGVTQIVAGTNVTISPPGGTGVVTINATTGAATNGLPVGGTAGQILAKIDSTNYNAEWIDNYAQWTSQLKHEVKAGEAINKGQAVYVSSADGTNMIVSKASNATEMTSSKTMGLLAQTLALNGKGFVITEGLLAGLDTSTAAAGDPVWLGTNGNLLYGLANKPVAPAHMVFIGIVTRSNNSNGEIFVKVQNGFELDELHDVLISAPSAGQLLRRDSDGLWKNWTPNFLTTVPTLAQVTTAGNTTTNAISVGKITTTGSITAVTNLAQGVYFNNTLVAAANNDVLVGLDVNPTFTNGAFTGVANLAIRTKGDIQINGFNYNFGNAGFALKTFTGNTNISFFSADSLNGTGPGFGIYDNINARYIASLRAGAPTNAIFLSVNGNLAIGYTTLTDAGYKLDINGTARIQGDLSTASGKNMLFGTTLPSRHTNSAAYPGIFVGNSNSSVMGETFSGYKGIILNANIVRDTSLSWVHQDTTQPGWQMGLNYETANTDRFGIIRSAPTAGIANFVSLFTIKGTGNVLINTTTDSGYKLDVNGSFRSNGDTLVTAANGRIAGFTGLGSGQTVHLQYGGDSNHRISTTYGSGVIFDAFHGVTVRTSTASTGKALIVNQRNSAHYIQEWQDNGTTRAFIDSGGNLFLSPLNTAGNGFVTATGGILNTTAYGYTGIITFPTNPPGQQNLDFQNGILVNVF